MAPYNRVFIGKLPNDVSEREVEKLTREYGRIKELRALPGYAFVEFQDDRDARDCVERLDGQSYAGRRIIVEPAKGERRERNDRDRGDRDRDDRRSDRYAPRGGSGRGDYRIDVIGLPSRTSWQDLKDLMRKAGEVVYTDITHDGDGIVEFSNQNDMEEALRLFDGYDYKGNTLKVKEGKSGAGRGDRNRSPAPARRRSPSPRRRSPSPRRRSPSPRRRRSPSPARGRSRSPRR
ncbi:hypothetical protein BC832DRAFT_547070 [Gaertneriomyces semiglobifer]|nr:hypothetical protein BC832DRAFT_547070 [Gaertneriomyces semiglobifer]